MENTEYRNILDEIYGIRALSGASCKSCLESFKEKEDMMNKTRHTSRLGMVALLGVILGMGTLVAGCNEPGETAKKPATKVETDAPVGAAPAVKTPNKPAAGEEAKDPRAQTPEAGEPLEVSVDGIAAANDFFKWFELRTKYRVTGERNEEIEAALANKEQELLEKEPAQAFNDSLEIVAFNWRLQNEDSDASNNATFLVSCLFHKTGAINFETDHRVLLYLRGIPDKSHVRHFKSETSRTDGFFGFYFTFDPSIDEWDKGEYYLMIYKTNRPVPNVPYRMQISFSKQEKQEDGTWQYAGRFGDRIGIPGWRVDLGE